DAATPFFNAAERLLIDTLADEQIDFEQFDQRVVELADALDAVTEPPLVLLDPTTAAAVADGGHAWQIPIGDASRPGAVFEQLLPHTLASTYSPLVVWWTEGSAMVEPSCLVVKGLPDPAGFGALLDGSWASYRWRPVPAQIDSSATIEMRIEGSPPDGFRSA